MDAKTIKNNEAHFIPAKLHPISSYQPAPLTQG